MRNGEDDLGIAGANEGERHVSGKGGGGRVDGQAASAAHKDTNWSQNNPFSRMFSATWYTSNEGSQTMGWMGGGKKAVGHEEALVTAAHLEEAQPNETKPVPGDVESGFHLMRQTST